MREQPQPTSTRPTGNEEDGTWRWNLEWMRALFDWEREEAAELQQKIDSMQIYKDIPYTWKWEHSKEGNYSTKSAYKLLTNEINGLDAAPIHKRVWNPIIPSKISAFNWQLLQDRIPTKSNLQKRGITIELDDGICALCEEEVEDSNHLFPRCKVAKWLWKACGKWWGTSVNLENDCWKTFEQFGAWAKEKRVKEGWDCIWNVVVWTIWLARNQKIFQETDISKSTNSALQQLRVPDKEETYLLVISILGRYLLAENENVINREQKQICRLHYLAYMEVADPRTKALFTRAINMLYGGRGDRDWNGWGQGLAWIPFRRRNFIQMLNFSSIHNPRQGKKGEQLQGLAYSIRNSILKESFQFHR
ncbi:hypothetical protein SLEP1_g1573 [Rubroshorea leprosula]|uniref:Reverse transcriptase zinc-binding domain-containing protein n=1 Tax=Rubroshorea leprosula TaxID=152421 RepID=A0AAV5HMH5_9ROSI|nr:hypothetical protein SLEP1_g1573 [Rubroshorea leprosula]